VFKEQSINLKKVQEVKGNSGLSGFVFVFTAFHLHTFGQLLRYFSSFIAALTLCWISNLYVYIYIN